MQLSSINLKPHPSVNASSDSHSSLPFIGNITNIDTRPQTASSVQDTAIAGTSQHPVLHQLQSIEQSEQILLQESEESQLTSVLRSLPKLDELYYDEEMTKSLIKDNDPRKNCYVELYSSALCTQAAWYRVQNRVLDLMYYVPLGRKPNISKGRMGLAVAITNLIKNKIKHQTCLNKLQTENFDFPNNADSTTRQKTKRELDDEMKRAREFLTRHRREYFYTLPQRGIERSAIIESLPQYLLAEYSFKAIKDIFTSLPEEKIKSLVQYHLSSLFSPSVNKMEDSAFKIQRKPVPESFWYSLNKCSDRDWKTFNNHFFLFLLSSWLSEPEYLLWQNQELKKAVKTNKVREECQILVDRLLPLSLRISAQRIFYQILSFAKEHESLISKHNIDMKFYISVENNKKLALNKLNEIYPSTFATYIERRKVDWNLKTPKECRVQAKLLNMAINSAHTIRKRLSKDEILDIKRFLDFIYAVLLHFRDNNSIQLADLNDIAIRTITKPIVQQIPSTLEAPSQSLKRKCQDDDWWEAYVLERNFMMISPNSQKVSTSSNELMIHSVDTSENTLIQDAQFQQLLDDIQEVIEGGEQEVTAQEQMLKHEEYRNILSSLTQESPIQEGSMHRESQLVSESGTSSPNLKFFSQMIDSNNESQASSSNMFSMLNFESTQQDVSVQDVVLSQLFPGLVGITSVIPSTQEEALTTKAQTADTSALLDVYDLESE